MKCTTPAGTSWPIARRYSTFCELESELQKAGNPAMRGVFFPKKAMFYSVWGKALWGSKKDTDPDSSDSRKRRDQLQAWINEVIVLCLGDRSVAMFLAKDGSVPPEQARQIGCEVEVVDEKAHATKVAGRAMQLEQQRVAANAQLQAMDLEPNKVCKPTLCSGASSCSRNLSIRGQFDHVNTLPAAGRHCQGRDKARRSRAEDPNRALHSLLGQSLGTRK
jgi:hypothetical protein